MNKVLQIGLIGGGAYLLYKFGESAGWFGGVAPVMGAPAPAGGQPSPATPPAPMPAGTGTAVTSPAKGAGGAITVQPQEASPKQKVAYAMANSGFAGGNVDQMGFFYAQALGTPAPAPESYGAGDRSIQYTLDSWWPLVAGVVRLPLAGLATGYVGVIW